MNEKLTPHQLNKRASIAMAIAVLGNIVFVIIACIYCTKPYIIYSGFNLLLTVLAALLLVYLKREKL